MVQNNKLHYIFSDIRLRVRQRPIAADVLRATQPPEGLAPGLLRELGLEN